MTHIKGTWQIGSSKCFHFPGKIHMQQSVESKFCGDSETRHIVESLKAWIIWMCQNIPSMEAYVVTFNLSHH